MKKIELKAAAGLVNDEGTGLRGTLSLSLQGPGGLIRYVYEVEGRDSYDVYSQIDKVFSRLAEGKRRQIRQGKLSVLQRERKDDYSKESADLSDMDAEMERARRSVLQRERNPTK